MGSLQGLHAMTDTARLYPPETEWFNESDLALESKLLELERGQLHTSRLLMRLQAEARDEARITHAHLDAISAKQDELMALVRKLGSNGHGA